jgi:hypothetical protein
MLDPPAAPIRRRSLTIAGCALLVGIGVVLGLLQVCRRINPFDEAIFLVGSDRILSGDVPFRDFYALYPPGQYYVVAALLETFGRSVLTVRVYCLVVRALIALLLFLLCVQRVAPSASSSTGACVLWLSGYRNFGYPVFPALALALLGLVLLASRVEQQRSISTRSALRLWGAGAAMGAAALFRHDIALSSQRHGLAPRAPRPRRDAAPVWAYPPASRWRSASGGMASRGRPVRELCSSCSATIDDSYPLVRGFPTRLFSPTGSAETLSDPAMAKLREPAVLRTVAVLRSASCRWVSRLHARGRAALVEPSLTLLTLVILRSLAFIPARCAPIRATRRRCSCSYPVAMALLSAAGGVAAGGVSRQWPPSASWRSWRSRAGVHAPWCRANRMTRASTGRRLPGCRGRPGRGGLVPALGGAARGRSSSAACHDIIFANEPILYFLSSGCRARYHLLDPGVATTLPVQREIVDELIRIASVHRLSSEFAMVRGGTSAA